MKEKLFINEFTSQLCSIPDLNIKTYHYMNNLYKIECYVSHVIYPDGHSEQLTSRPLHNIGSNFLDILGLLNYGNDSQKHSLVCINNIRNIIENSEDISALLKEYVDACNKFPFFQMYADIIYKLIHSSNNGEHSRLLLEALHTLEQNIEIIFDYLLCGVLYPNLSNNKNSIKRQLFEYEEIREYKAEKKYYLEWDLEDRKIIDKYPHNVYKLYFSPYQGYIENQCWLLPSFETKRATIDINSRDNASIITYSTNNPSNNTKITLELESLEKECDFIQTPKSCNDISLKQEFLNLINYLDSTNRTIVRCKNCGRHFITINNLEKTRYCNLLFQDTKCTCQEIMVNKRYKSSKNANPISKIYTTVYNRVFSRVRRGTLDISCAPYEELRNLRDRYFSIYDSADESRKKDVEEEFLKEINSIVNNILNPHGE